MEHVHKGLLTGTKQVQDILEFVCLFFYYFF